MEAAGYTTVVLLVLLILVQAAVWGMADLAARQAANHGLQTARVAGGTVESGESATGEMLAAINPNGITDVTVTVDRGPDTTSVTVSGAALRVIPVISIPVSVSVEAPTEPE